MREKKVPRVIPRNAVVLTITKTKQRSQKSYDFYSNKYAIVLFVYFSSLKPRW